MMVLVGGSWHLFFPPVPYRAHNLTLIHTTIDLPFDTRLELIVGEKAGILTLPPQGSTSQLLTTPLEAMTTPCILHV